MICPMTWAEITDIRVTGSERKRSTTPVAKSVAVATPAPMTPKARLWPRRPGQQVVLVADSRNVDGGAEHVQEEQREHDRLDGHVAQPLRDPGRSSAAPGDQKECLAEVSRESLRPGR